MRRISVIVVLALFLLLFLSCAGRQPQIAQPANTPTQNKAEIKLTSAAFKDGQPIPRAYTCDGVNISPPLEWSGVPRTAKTIAIICDDPDAPGGTWVHWVLYNLPAENIGLVENLPATETLKSGGFQGKNDFGKTAYGGPCPPSGTHRYFFRIYALDSELPLKAGATKAELMKAMDDHVVLQGQLMGTYRR
ncbi:MAG TPA: YbhB/YbcL family Raf kinase inhibitor-like protein [Pyrinomonadaceae bacterium]|nr:YbhB/YbcL family Raf kinase inhibitor-like protein [Pyrinomonadaceae bacterium]